MTYLIILIVVVVIGSGLFSGLEAALFAVTQSKVELFKEQKKRGASSLYLIKEKISRPITVIVIFNNIFNIVGSILVGAVASNVFESAGIGLISALLTLLIIIFGEIIPKTLGENYCDHVALFFAPALLFATRVLSPVVWTLEKVTSRLVTPKSIVSEEEIQMMSHLGSIEGSIEEDEREMIENVFTLNDTKASDVMTPRTIMTAFQEDVVLGDIEKEIYELSRSRLPVYGEDLDNIKGIIFTRDILVALGKDDKQAKIGDFVQEALFVDEDMKIDKILPILQEKRMQMAIVKDDFGGTAGLLTLEDILEELVGEIVDETDEVVDFQEEARKQFEESDDEVHEEDDEGNVVVS